jgi:hypothetical protein
VESLEEDLDRLLGVAGGVGVLEAEDQLAAVVPGVEPIEQRGARAANVEETRWAGGESDADAHEWVSLLLCLVVSE